VSDQEALCTHPDLGGTYSQSSLTGGTLQWHTTGGCTGGTGSATPVVGGGAVWFNDTTLGTAAALGPTTGAPSTAKGPAQWSGSPAFDAKHGFFMVNGVLNSWNNDATKARWTFSGDGQLTGSPLVVHGYVYIGSASGKVFAVDETTGALVWTGDAGAPVLGDNHGNVDRPITALAAGQGLVVVPASTRLVAYGT
jgi:outer membrane protein assembly factor BamB